MSPSDAMTMRASTFRSRIAAAQPLYERCLDLVAAEIQNGSLAPGARLPSERSIAESLGFTRLTVRRALIAMAEEGLVTRAPKRGWQVATGPLSEPPNTLLSFTAMARSRGLVPSSNVLSAETREADLDEAESLQVAPGAPLMEARRVRLLDGSPVAVDRIRIAVTRLPWIRDFDWSTSLYSAMDAHGVGPARSAVCVNVLEAPTDLARLLEVPEGRGLLDVSGVAFDAQGLPICLESICYRPDRYRFRAVLERHVELERIDRPRLQAPASKTHS